MTEQPAPKYSPRERGEMDAFCIRQLLATTEYNGSNLLRMLIRDALCDRLMLALEGDYGVPLGKLREYRDGLYAALTDEGEDDRNHEDRSSANGDAVDQVHQARADQ